MKNKRQPLYNKDEFCKLLGPDKKEPFLSRISIPWEKRVLGKRQGFEICQTGET